MEMIVPVLDEWACFAWQGYIAVSEAILSGGMKLSLHPFFRYIFRQYNLALTQRVPNTWSQLAGVFLLWKGVTHARGYASPCFPDIIPIPSL